METAQIEWFLSRGPEWSLEALKNQPYANATRELLNFEANHVTISWTSSLPWQPGHLYASP